MDGPSTLDTRDDATQQRRKRDREVALQGDEARRWAAAGVRALATTIAEEYLTDSQLNVPEAKVREWLDSRGPLALAEALASVIATHRLPFPYKRTSMTDLPGKFAALCQYHTRPGVRLYAQPFTPPWREWWCGEAAGPGVEYCGPNALDPEWAGWPASVLFLSAEAEYREMNILTEFFQEPARMQASAGRNGCPLDHWTQPNLCQRWLRTMLLTPQAINTSTLREGLYLANVKEASQFKATVAHLMIRLLGARRVLDFSAGWGDRLLGALSCNDVLDFYCGVDPNPALTEGYAAMVETFLPVAADWAKYRLICEPFESCSRPLGCEWFDLVFTGPPYFTYERYTDAPGQSVDTYPDPAQWTICFLFGSVLKSWRRLAPGGHLALNFEDTRRLAAGQTRFVQPLHLCVAAALPDSALCGPVCFSGARVRFPRPIWVWRKAAPAETAEPPPGGGERQRTALADLRRLFPKVHAELLRRAAEWQLPLPTLPDDPG